MNERSTSELTEVLLSSSLGSLEDYQKSCLDSLQNLSFPEYFLSVLPDHGVSRSEAIADSGLEIHYAYQILNGSRHPTRDKILCLCIGGRFSLLETNRALERAFLGRLYPKRMRDAIIMIALNRRISAVWQVNELLAEHGEPLLN